MKIVKNILAVLFLLGQAECLLAQQTVDAVIITEDGKTIKSKVKVRTNYFDRTMLDELSFYRRVVLMTDTGKTVMKEHEIVRLEFTDFMDRKRIFVRNDDTFATGHRKRLFEEMITGRLSWYREYYPHGYDGSVQAHDYLILKGRKPEFIGLKGRKKWLLELTSDFPELKSKIDALKFNTSMLDIVREFNELSGDPKHKEEN